VQRRSMRLVSGAGHDAVVMSQVAPVAMLFVRCRDGLSHHPDEFAAPKDLNAALRVTIDFIERLAGEHRPVSGPSSKHAPDQKRRSKARAAS
jgi:allantoate deiminase